MGWRVHTSSALSQLSPAPAHPTHHMPTHTHPPRPPRAPSQTHSRKGGKKSSEQLTVFQLHHKTFLTFWVRVCTRSQVTRCWHSPTEDWGHDGPCAGAQHHSQPPQHRPHTGLCSGCSRAWGKHFCAENRQNWLSNETSRSGVAGPGQARAGQSAATPELAPSPVGTQSSRRVPGQAGHAVSRAVAYSWVLHLPAQGEAAQPQPR